jgi:hypothetical protein
MVLRPVPINFRQNAREAGELAWIEPLDPSSETRISGTLPDDPFQPLDPSTREVGQLPTIGIFSLYVPAMALLFLAPNHRLYHLLGTWQGGYSQPPNLH